MRSLVAAFGIVVALSGCGAPASKAGAEEVKPKGIDGYREFKFGMPFSEALSLSGASSFNPASVKGCMVDRAIRGCILFPESNLETYTTIDGVPYGLGLAFNRFDKLTDITLRYKRSMIDDEDEKMSLVDCRAIHERTLDWLVREYGKFPVKPKEDSKIAKTAKGNEYFSYESDGSFIGEVQMDFSDKRRVSLLSHYIVVDGSTDCTVQAEFSDADTVERWEMSPDEKRQFDEVVGK